MDTALVSFEAIDFLSRMTGQKLRKEDITSPVIFLAALLSLLLGVIYIDSKVTNKEKQQLKTILNQLMTSGSDVRRLGQLMTKGIQQQQVYQKPNELLVLTAPFSESERLLLISFGYQMSVADGKINSGEKKYLETVANQLGINTRHLGVLEAAFSRKAIADSQALDAVTSLLDPVQFQSLDRLFINAATHILADLPIVSKQPTKQKRLTISYSQLRRFQAYRQQLKSACHQLAQIVQDGINLYMLPNNLAEEIGKASHKLSSQRFRLAVVGEFSQGKSTLLNALIGEEIQPVRAIPCSGTVTVLKYGSRKRVICHYKDGRKEEISSDLYQVRAAISEEIAIGNVADELAHSEIDEIIFEHPDLNLCSSGVEIVDSPGLNEHPNRTAITQKLLENTDAVIFLTNASRSLSQGERDLIQDLKMHLNGGQPDVPADNLFILVNFMDLLRREKDRQDVRQRLEKFVHGQTPIVTGENRIHFISAQAALDAILEETENEFTDTFQGFTQSFERFLTLERGSLEIKQSVTRLKQLIQESLDGMAQAEEILDGKLELSEAERQKILEQIGEASGRDVRIRVVANQLINQAVERANESWQEWLTGLRDRINHHSAKWSSDHNPVFSQDKLIQDYINQFIRDLSQEVDAWGSIKLGNVILQEKLEVLDSKISWELEAIKSELENLDRQVQTHLSDRLNLAISGIEANFIGDKAFLGGIGVGGALAAALIFFTPLGWVSVIVASLTAAFFGEIGSGMLGFDGIKDQIKCKVIEIGLQKFDESGDKVAEKLYEIVSSVFEQRVESANQVIAQAIALYENLLEQQERVHTETLEQGETEKAFIEEKRQELEQMQKNLEAILEQGLGEFTVI